MQLAKLSGRPEIFYTLQGEGFSMGRPAIFVRLAKCNLACVWCDTPYTWNWTTTNFKHEDDIKYIKKDEIVHLTPMQVADIISSFDCNRVVFTGGEPMLQQRDIVEVCFLLGQDYIFEIETNGTISPTQNILNCITQFNVSPKLSSSGNKPNKAIKDAILKSYCASNKSFFKFVIGTEDDFYEAMQVIENCNIDRMAVYFMPEGRDEQAIQKNSKILADICKELAVNFTTRLHVLLWGAKKGV